MVPWRLTESAAEWWAGGPSIRSICVRLRMARCGLGSADRSPTPLSLPSSSHGSLQPRQHPVSHLGSAERLVMPGQKNGTHNTARHAASRMIYRVLELPH